MRKERSNNEVTVYLEGRINSENAAKVQTELEAIAAEHPGSDLVLDAKDLVYISSAGLRVLLQIAKRQGGSLQVKNVSPEVYEIFDMTGFTEILQVSKRLREFSVEGCEVIGRGAIGTVYRVDEDTIVKLYELPDSLPMIENEQRRAKQAFLKGLPTAISYDVVRVGDKYGSVFELLKASTYNDLLIDAPERVDEITRQYASLMHQIHAVEMKRGELPEAKAVFLDYLEQLRGMLPDDLYQRLHQLFAALPENLHMIHGDIQMKNVMVSGGEPLLIDMDTLSVGDPVFDLMGIFVTYKVFNEDDPVNTQEFLGLPPDLCDEIWKKTIAYYFEGRSQEAITEAEKKIRIVGYVRFLFLIDILGIGKPELTAVRNEHSLAHLRELAGQVDSLAVN